MTKFTCNCISFQRHKTCKHIKIAELNMPDFLKNKKEYKIIVSEVVTKQVKPLTSLERVLVDLPFMLLLTIIVLCYFLSGYEKWYGFLLGFSFISVMRWYHNSINKMERRA